MRLVFTPHGWEDYTHWQTADRAILKRINRLVEEVLRDPFEGIGKLGFKGSLQHPDRLGCGSDGSRSAAGAAAGRA